MSQIILHPEIQKLSGEIALLREDLAGFLTEAHDLVHIVKPNLLALYQTKIGAWELKLLQSQVRAMRLKRKLELARASMNRGSIPDWSAIENQLQSEFITWQKRIQEAADALQEAEDREFLSPSEDRELKKLYHAMVKMLHPDLNSDLTDEQKRLWQRVQDAYEDADIETLGALAQAAQVFSGSLSAKSLDALHAEKAALRRHIAETVKRIKAIESQPPFTMRAQLNDSYWVEARRAEVESKIADAAKQEELFLSILQPIVSATHGQFFGPN